MPTVTLAPRTLDTDTSRASVSASHALALRNVVPFDGYLGLAPGTVAQPAVLALPPGRNLVVGAVADHKGQSILRFIWNEAGEHRLVRFYPAMSLEVELLRPPLLDLQEKDLICHTGIVSDYLFWLDRDGLQFRLNMTVAGAGGYAASTEPYLLRLARPVPMYPANVIRTVFRNNPPFNYVGGNDWQISYRYGYTDNDVTVLCQSDVSVAIESTRSREALFISLVPDEKPSEAVERIEFYARKNDSAIWQKIKVLKRDPSGVMPREFYFLGQGLGESLSDMEAEKLSEAIPITSQALEAADNRVFLANNEVGLAPTDVALSVAVEDVPAQTFLVRNYALYQQKIEQIGDVESERIEYFSYFLLLSGTFGTSNALYVNATYNQYLDAYFDVPNAPIFKAEELPNETFRQLRQTGNMQNFYKETGLTRVGDGTVRFIEHNTLSTVKSLCTRQFGVVFFDYAGRSSGTLTNDNAVVSIPDLALNTATPVARQIRWTLSAVNADKQIPPWAVAYQIFGTPADTVLAFRQFHVAEVLHLAIGADPAKPTFVGLTDAGGPLWLDISPLESAGEGYVWQADSNDRVRMYEKPNSTVYYDYKITGQLGNYLVVDTVGGKVNFDRNTRVEIYSPRENVEARYYSIGPRYPILRTPTSVAYSVLTDALPGDVYLTTQARQTVVGLYVDEQVYAPSIDGKFYVQNLGINFTQLPQDLYNNYFSADTKPPKLRKYGLNTGRGQQYGTATKPPYGAGGLPGFFEVTTDIPGNSSRWLNERGQPSTVLSDGPPLPAKREYDVCWGGVLLPGSRINGLSSFEDASVVTVGQERGPITALALANQQQSTGTVLVAVQAFGGTSLYLGEAVSQTGGGVLQVDTSKVVGTLRPLTGSKGSVHAGSLTAWNGVLYMWSQQAATWLRYDQSGITDLCVLHKCTALGRELAALKAFRVVGGYDPVTRVCFFTFSYIGLDDAVHTRTEGFSERADGFCGSYDFAPPCYVTLSEALYSFQDASVHVHDGGAPRNTFYGTLQPAQVRAIVNQELRRSKEWLSLAYHGTDAWDTPLLTNEQESGRMQQSKTYAGWAAWRLGAYTVALRRDQLQPVRGNDGVYITDPDVLLHQGRPLQSPWLEVNMELVSDKNVRLDGVSVNFNMLSGQQALPN